MSFFFQIYATDLQSHLEALGELMLKPSMMTFTKLLKIFGQLHDAMKKYLDRLMDQQKRNNVHHMSVQPVRDRKDNFKLEPLNAIESPTVRLDLRDEFRAAKPYQIIALEKYLPPDRSEHLTFIRNLHFEEPATMMTYSYGNHLGNIYFLWKAKDGDKEQEVSAVKYVLDNLRFFPLEP